MMIVRWPRVRRTLELLVVGIVLFFALLCVGASPRAGFLSRGYRGPRLSEEERAQEREARSGSVLSSKRGDGSALIG